MADTDISLSVGLDVQDAEKTAKQLQKEIEDIFESRRGEQSASLTSLEIQMKKNYDSAVLLTEKMRELSTTQPTVQSEEFQKVDQEFDSVIAKIEETQQRLQKLYDTRDVKQHDPEIEALGAQMDALYAQYDEIEKRRDELIAAGQDMIPVETTENYKKLETQLDLVNDKLKQQIVRYNEIEMAQQRALEKAGESAAAGGALDTLKQSKSEVASVNKSMMSLTSTVRGLGRIIPGVSTKGLLGISMLTRGVNRLTHLTKEDLTNALGSIKGTFGKLLSLVKAHPIAAAIGVTVAAVAMLAKKIKEKWEEARKKVAEALKELGKALLKVVNLSGKLIANITKGFLNLGTFVAKRTIRIIQLIINKLMSLKSLFTENLKEMAKWNKGNNEVNESLSNITSSLAYLKAAITTVIAPILTTVEPLITSLTDKIAEMTTNVGMLIAKLTGKNTFQKAIRIQKDYAKSLDESSGSLASFDKLNVINNDDKAVDFELVNLEETQIPNWFDDLEALGRRIGVVVTNFLGNIPWDDVMEKASKAGQSIADFLNGFLRVEGIGDAVGRAFGKAINTITTFVNDFLAEFDGVQLGKDIGNALEFAIKSIDFGELGKMFSSSVNELADIIIGFTDKFSGKELGDKITEFLKTALGDINWDTIQLAVNGLVTDLVEMMNAVITPENFALIGKTLGNILNTLFTGVKLFTEEAEWTKWGDSIAASINEFFSTFDFKASAEAISNLADGLLDMLLEAVGAGEGEGIDWELVGDKIIEFLSNIQWEDLATKAVEISEKLKEALGKILDKLEDSDVFDKIIDFIVTFLSEKKNWEEAFKNIKDKIITEVIKGKIRYWWNHSVKTFFTKKKWQELGEKAFPGLTKSFDTLKTNLTQKIDGIKERLKTKFNSIKIDTQSIWGKMIQKIIEVWTKLKDALKAPLNAVIGVINTAVNFIIDGINAIIDSFNKLSFKIPEWLPDWITGGMSGKEWNPGISRINHIDIKGLATGAVIPPNMSNFLAMLGDNNKETEVVSPLSTIEQALRNVMAEQNINVTFQVEGDPNKLFTVVQKEARNFTRRTGSLAFGKG